MACIEGVIFDLGNTLVMYFDHEQWPGVLDEAIGNVRELLDAQGFAPIEAEELARRVAAQRGSSSDKVVPLRSRLEKIFPLAPAELERLHEPMQRAFCKAVFAQARLCDDALKVLGQLRSRGLKTAILSNTPWGTPGWAWRAHLADLGLDDAVDVLAFCDDVGWRKPDPRAFWYVLERLGLPAGKCLFVGDEPRWDIQGPLAVGMRAVQIDRVCGPREDCSHPRISSLHELEGILADFDREASGQNDTPAG
jgi:HAD superfamily hydrolase (TIGR01509 family)